MKKQELRSSFILLLTATIWGVSFVAQNKGMEFVRPFTLNFFRHTIGGLVLLLYMFVLNRGNASQMQAYKNLNCEGKKQYRHQLLKGGLVCGLLNFVSGTLQQFGVCYTSVGKAGFLTSLFVVIVPLLGLFFKRKCGRNVWIGVVLAVFGLYFLCITDRFYIEFGDLLMILCALAVSVNIMLVDHYNQFVSGVAFSCIRTFVVGGLSGICMLIFDKPQLHNIVLAWQSILYLGFLTCGIADTLSVIGQKGMNPTKAALILSLQSVISVLAGWVLLNETLTIKELIGCAFMFVAIILAQLPGKKNEMKQCQK